MLHFDVAGDGPDLVLLHGWGMHSGVWGEWLVHLQRYFRVTAVDLPGHGKSRFQGQRELEEWVAAVLEVAPPCSCWVGWSLGGLVALRAASQARNRFSGLLLLASTPKFVMDKDWMHAVPAEVFSQFARQLETDAGRTLARFLSLQVRCAQRGNETLRQLRGDLRSRPAADPGALRAGLRLLQECDLRSAIRGLDMPLFWLLGERDTLIPARLARDFPGIASTVIPGAGHAPFLSHPQQCANYVRKNLLRQHECQADAAG